MSYLKKPMTGFWNKLLLKLKLKNVTELFLIQNWQRALDFVFRHDLYCEALKRGTKETAEYIGQR